MDENEYEQCGICGGPLGELGVLGNLRWLQCRNCGMQWSSPANEEGERVMAAEADAAQGENVVY
jgi:hypothetical protein